MIDVDALRLAAGSHSDGPGPDDPTCELCLFEAYNLLDPVDPEDPDQVTDACPAAVSPVLYAYGVRLNDVLSDERRQGLKTLLPGAGRPSPLAGTWGDGLDEARGYLALDWLVRTYTPAWLDLAGLTAEAQSLRDLPPIVDPATARAAAWAAVWSDVWSAVRGAAGGAVWDVVGAAVRRVVRDAVGDVAETVAWGVVEDVVGAAARAAGRGVLQPVVDQLQDSAVDLYHRMISPRG